jgi:hypothetical protein
MQIYEIKTKPPNLFFIPYIRISLKGKFNFLKFLKGLFSKGFICEL